MAEGEETAAKGVADGASTSGDTLETRIVDQEDGEPDMGAEGGSTSDLERRKKSETLLLPGNPVALMTAETALMTISTEFLCIGSANKATEDNVDVQPMATVGESIKRRQSQHQATKGTEDNVVVQPMATVGESNKRRRPQYPSRLPRGGDHPVDSVPCMINELERLLEYIASRPKLSEGSASFMRDYLRTMLMMSSNAASNEMTRKIQDGTSAKATIDELPHEVVRHVFSFLEGNDLAKVRVVCKQWNIFATEDVFWKELCLRGWASLETDQAAWKLVDPKIKMDDPHKWRKLYPRVQSTPRWKCRLQKTGKFICNLRAHHISGPPLGEQGLPYTLVVERRFNIAHLHTFVLPEATILYLEPVTPQDRPGFEQFIDYLVKRTRAGLALEGDRRFIFVPPCDYSRDLKYEGQSLLGVVQGFFPPLQS